MRGVDNVDGEHGGGTGRGVNITSICGSPGMEVEMVWYCSWSIGNKD